MANREGRGNGSRWVQISTIIIAIFALVFANLDAIALRNDLERARDKIHANNLRIEQNTRRVKSLHQDLANTRKFFARLIRHSVSQGFKRAPRQLSLRLISSSRPLYCWGKRITMYGTNGIDFLTGTPSMDVIHSLGGDDSIFGDGGNDRICGGKGNDTLVGEPGNDYMSGGPGNDVCRGEHKRKCER